MKKAMLFTSIVAIICLVGYVCSSQETPESPSAILLGDFGCAVDFTKIYYSNVISVELIEGKLYVTCRVTSPYGIMTTEYRTDGKYNYTPDYDYMIKDIYAAKDGEIVLERSIKGNIIPEKTIPESIEWEK